MNTKLQNGNQGVHVDNQVENDSSDWHFETIGQERCFENTDLNIKIEIDDIKNYSCNADSHLQNFGNGQPNIDVGLQNINQQIEVKEEKFDQSLFVNFEINSLNFEENGNFHKNMDSVLESIKEEVAEKKERVENLLPAFENKDNVTLHNFENTESNSLGKNNAGMVVDGFLVEGMYIKQEIEDHCQVQISVTEGKNYTKYVKNHLNSSDTDLTTEGSNLTSTTDLVAGSSTIEQFNVKIETNCHTYDNINLKCDGGDVKIENFDSGVEAMDCKNEDTYSLTGAFPSKVDRKDNNKLEIVDSHPNLLIKLLPVPGKLSNQGLEVCHIIRNDFCQPENISSSESYQKEEDMSSNASSSLGQHQFTQNNERPDRISERGLKKVEQLRNHMISHSTECPSPVCNNQLNTLHMLRANTCKFTHSTERPHQCNVCDEGFKRSDALTQHMITHSTERPHQCNVCNTLFKRSDALTQHMIAHSTERPYQCNVCYKGFKRSSVLRQHLITHSTERPHQCNVCEKRFKRAGDLKSHMICHNREGPHQCNVCDREFRTSAFLKQHLTSHITERPYQCNVCETRFKRAGDLKSHMSCHNTEILHQCNVCGKDFNSPRALRSHMITHSTERPHRCNVCYKGFKRSYVLRQHLITHSTERPHRCNVCGKDFKTSNALKRHDQSQH